MPVLTTLLAWPARALLSPMGNVRWKIIAPYAGLTVLLAIAGTYLVTRLVGGSLDERFNNQLAEAGRVASDSLVRRERKHLEGVRGITFTEGVGAATASGNGFDLARLIQPLASNTGIERVEVVDGTGHRVFGAQLEDASTLRYASIVEDSDRSAWTSVQRVLAGESDGQGDKFTEITDTGDGHVLYTAGPIFDGTRLVGAVLVGTPLTSFLAGAKAESLADITVYDGGGAALGSTFAPDADGRPLDLAATAAVLPQRTGELVREHRTLYGRDYDLMYGALTVRGDTVGYYSAGLPSSFIFSAQATTRVQMAVLFAVAMLGSLLVGWLISLSITRPIDRLVRATNAVSTGDLLARSGVDGRDEIGVLGRAFDAMTERLQRQHLATVRALTSAIDARDPYTLGHSLRVGQLAVELGQQLGLGPSQLQHLEIGGYLHDIGKIGVRDAVLLKPGALTPEERAAIERHPSIGLDILDAVELAPEVLEFVGGHHEKLNGSGYPRHLHGDELSIVPRIAAVADIYDALVTDRPYRAGMSVEQALGILRREAGEGMLDPAVITALENIIPRWEHRRRTEPGLRGFSIDQADADEEAKAA